MVRLRSDLLATHELLGALESSIEVSRTIFDNLSPVLCITDNNGIILKPNRMCLRYMDKSDREVIGQPFVDMIHPKARTPFKEYFDNINQRRDARPISSSFLAEEDSDNYIFWQVNFVKPDSTTKVSLNVIVGSNTNELRRAYEAQMIQLSTLSSMATLAGGVAHELNNPLAVIRGSCEILSADPDIDNQSRELLKKVTVHSDRISTIVDHLRKFSTRKSLKDWQPVNLNEPLTRSLDFLAAQIRSLGIRLDMTLAEDLPSIFGDENEIETIVQILFNNSVDSFDSITDDRIRTITIRTERTIDNNTVLSFKDNGCGMDSKTVQRIYEPFFTTKEVGKGTGLGLSLFHNVLKLHNGIVEVHSALNQGTEFVLSFPGIPGE